MRDGTRAFFQIQGIFHYFWAFFLFLKNWNSPYLFTDWTNTKIVIPLIVGDQREIFTASHLHFGE